MSKYSFHITHEAYKLSDKAEDFFDMFWDLNFGWIDELPDLSFDFDFSIGGIKRSVDTWITNEAQREVGILQDYYGNYWTIFFLLLT